MVNILESLLVQCTDNWITGQGRVKPIKRYTYVSCDPMLSKVSPLCRILIQLQTDSVFNLFFASLLEIGETKINTLWQAIQKPVNYKAWIQPCCLLGSLEQETIGVSSETKGRSQVQVKSTDRRARYLLSVHENEK